MSDLVINLIEAHGILALLMAIFLVCYPKKPDFRLNRWLLLSIPCFALIAGFFQVPLDTGLHVNNAYQQITGIPVAANSPVSGQQELTWNIWQLISAGYCLVACFMLLWGLYKIGKIVFLIKSHESKKFEDHTVVYTASQPVFSFLHFLIWNEKLSTDENDKYWAFRHELSHIRQKHTWDLIFIWLVRCVFWVNPMVYVLGRQIKQNHEYLADQDALTGNEHLEDYGNLILRLQLSLPANAFTNYFGNTQIKNRINMLTQQFHSKQKQRFNGIIIAFAALLFTGFLACTDHTKELPDANDEKPENQSQTETKPMNKVEQPAEFKGGRKALFKYISDNITYPEQLQNKGKTGSVVIAFTIGKQGQVQEVEIEQKAEEAAFNKAAMQVIKAMPEWKPAKQNGEPVRTRMQLPIRFSPN